MSYPPDFQSWPQERRNAWFAAEAGAYRETKAPGNGAADHAKLQGGFDRFDSSLGKGFRQNNGAWPEPKSIESALPPVAPFDAELLPEALRDYALDVADRAGASRLCGRSGYLRPRGACGKPRPYPP